MSTSNEDEYWGVTGVPAPNVDNTMMSDHLEASQQPADSVRFSEPARRSAPEPPHQDD